jgi:cellulose synthase/poly-beta-1,6-N-acetylglucosamine synthase-like glycosyltransferase
MYIHIPATNYEVHVLTMPSMRLVATAFVQRIRWARGSWDMLKLDCIIFSRHLTFRQKASWYMLGYMPIVALCILITIIFRFARPYSSDKDIYSWIVLTIHFALARFTSLVSPGAGVVAPFYLMWRDSTAFFTYYSIHLFTLWTAITCTTAKFVTTGKENDDAEAGR